jgi:hypothetical protein
MKGGVNDHVNSGMIDEVVIDKRFRGPPNSGHGGYTSGMVAGYIDGPASVRLLRPPPLDRTLAVYLGGEGGQVSLSDGKDVIAVGRPAQFDPVTGSLDLNLDVPEPPAFEAAEDAMKNYSGFQVHFSPFCFVCGPKREKGDGINIFAGPTADGKMVTSTWVPDRSLAGDDGQVRPEFVWAALDCPGNYAATHDNPHMVVLGTLAASLRKPVFSGQRYIVIGWPIGSEGRKVYSGTALFTENGDLLANAKSTWIEVKSF